MRRALVLSIFLLVCLLLTPSVPVSQLTNVVQYETLQFLSHAWRRSAVAGEFTVGKPAQTDDASATKQSAANGTHSAEEVQSSNTPQNNTASGAHDKKDVFTALPRYEHFTKFQFPDDMDDECSTIQKAPPTMPTMGQLACLGVYEGVRGVSKGHWDERARVNMTLHPAFNVIHGGVSPSRLMQQGDFLLAVGGLQRFGGTNPLQTNVTIVEIGCGNGNLLFSMCPPLPNWKCFGTDFSALMIEHGRRHMPWIDLRWGIGAGHVPNGVADLGISHGIVPYLAPQVLCEHVAEELRVLKPGGVAVFWTINHKKFGTRIHPAFWHGKQGSDVGLDPQVALPFCSLLREFVAEVDFLFDPNMKPKPAIYPPGGGWYGIRIIRGAKDFPTQWISPVNVNHNQTESNRAEPELLRRYNAELQRFRRFSRLVKVWENGKRIRKFVENT